MIVPNPKGSQCERVLSELLHKERVHCYEFAQMKPWIMIYNARIAQLRNAWYWIESVNYRSSSKANRVKKSYFYLKNKEWVFAWCPTEQECMELVEIGVIKSFTVHE